MHTLRAPTRENAALVKIAFAPTVKELEARCQAATERHDDTKT